MKGLKVTDIGPQWSWGSRVDGVTWDNINDEEMRAGLRKLFEQRGFLIFENIDPSPKMQVELSKVFGPLKDHPTTSVPRADKDEMLGVIDMHYQPKPMHGYGQGLVEVDGKQLTSYLPWHFDHSYNDELNYAGVLRAVVAAPERGRTGFACGIELYKKMDPEILRKIDGLKALYTLDVRLTQMKFGKNFKTLGDAPTMTKLIKEAAIFPRSLHPMIWQRPTGEKVVHFCGFSAEGIQGHEDAAGNALFEAAIQDLYKNINPYWHSWRSTDLVIWDNRRILHAVEGCDPKYERRMFRTTIKGDYGLGAFEDNKKIGEVNRYIPPLDLGENQPAA